MFIENSNLIIEGAVHCISFCYESVQVLNSDIMLNVEVTKCYG